MAYVDAVQGVAADITVSALKVAKPAEFYTVKGVLFQVTVVVVGVQGAYSANPLFFTARDAAGDSYSAEFGATATDLGSGDVRPGQKLRGTVAFDVPKGQKIALVILADPLGRQVGAWTA